MPHERIGNERIENLRRRKDTETWFVRIIFCIGLIAWVWGIAIVVSRIVDIITAWVWW